MTHRFGFVSGVANITYKSKVRRRKVRAKEGGEKRRWGRGWDREEVVE